MNRRKRNPVADVSAELPTEADRQPSPVEVAPAVPSAVPEGTAVTTAGAAEAQAVGPPVPGRQPVAPRATGPIAVGALAIGAAAVGALAVGAFAVGRLVVNRFSLRAGRVRALAIEDLTVGRLRVGQLILDDGRFRRRRTRL